MSRIARRMPTSSAGRLCSVILVATIFTIVGCGTRGGTTLRGRVVAKDGRAGVPCAVEINSASEPFYSPALVETATGGEYQWAPGRASIDRVYVAARCDGYDVGMVSGITIKPGAGILVRDVVVVKTGTREPSARPSNKEMQRTKPAQAMELRR